jgi:hypothetical protein
VIADITVGNLYGLGLMARKTISDTEAEKVGVLARAMIRSPFKTLSREFDRIIAGADPASAFAELPVIHATALAFATPSSSKIPVPRQLAMHADDEAALESWAKDKLSAQLIDGFWALLDEHWAEDPEKRQRLELVAAA